MFTPTDERLAELAEEATDSLINRIEDELDEGEWADNVRIRCDQLGLEMRDYLKMREVIEEIMCLGAARACLARVRTKPPGEAEGQFSQGSGWIKPWRGGE